MWDHIDSVTNIKKAPDNPARHLRNFSTSNLAAGKEIHDREQHDYRKRADNEHVAHIVPGDGGTRFGRAFNDPVFFYARHMIAP
jgi:hypothetical protein